MFNRSGCVLAIVLILVAGNSLLAQEKNPAVDIDRLGTAGGGFAVNTTIGWEFSVVSPVTVKSLGVWDTKVDGLATEIPVGLWDASGKLLASVTVPAGKQAPEIDEFRYLPIEPLRLRPGQNYVIGAAYKPQTKEFVGGGGTATTFFTDGAIRWLRSRRIIGQAGLAFPKPAAAIPGGFGPNLLLAQSTTPRRYYRVLKVDDARRNVTVNVPESADGSHEREFVVLVSLFAKKDGELTQILLNGAPLGSGREALDKLHTAADRAADEMEKAVGVRPNLRIAASSWVQFDDVMRVVDAATAPRVSPRVRRTPAQKLEFASLVDNRIRHVATNPSDRFIDHGEYVEDTWTGLLWQKDGEVSGKMNFYAAAEYAARQELGGLSGWRVPTIEELASLFPAVDAPFTGSKYIPDSCCQSPKEYASYWTSELAKGDDYAYAYQWYANGGPNNCYASRNYEYVRCVHDPLPALQEKAAEEKAAPQEKESIDRKRLLERRARLLEEKKRLLEEMQRLLDKQLKDASTNPTPSISEARGRF